MAQQGVTPEPHSAAGVRAGRTAPHGPGGPSATPPSPLSEATASRSARPRGGDRVVGGRADVCADRRRAAPGPGTPGRARHARSTPGTAPPRPGRARPGVGGGAACAQQPSHPSRRSGGARPPHARPRRAGPVRRGRVPRRGPMRPRDPTGDHARETGGSRPGRGELHHDHRFIGSSTHGEPRALGDVTLLLRLLALVLIQRAAVRPSVPAVDPSGPSGRAVSTPCTMPRAHLTGDTLPVAW